MAVRTERGEAQRLVVVDGDLAAPATLVQLRATLSSLAFVKGAPVVVDLTGATGTSNGVRRLLDRIARLMAHRAVPFRVEAGARAGRQPPALRHPPPAFRHPPPAFRHTKVTHGKH